MMICTLITLYNISRRQIQKYSIKILTTFQLIGKTWNIHNQPWRYIINFFSHSPEELNQKKTRKMNHHPNAVTFDSAKFLRPRRPTKKNIYILVHHVATWSCASQFSERAERESRTYENENKKKNDNKKKITPRKKLEFKIEKMNNITNLNCYFVI